MRKRICLLLAMLFMSLCATAAAGPDGSPIGFAVVNGRNIDGVQVRAEPSQSSELLGVLFNGKIVSYYSDGIWWLLRWVEVGLPGGRGYIKANELYRGNEADIPAQTRPATVVGVEEDSVLDVLTPDFEGNMAHVAQLRPGDRVMVEGEMAAGWSLVIVGGERGYIETKYLRYDEVAYINAKAYGKIDLRETPSLMAPSLGTYYTGVQVICLSELDQTWTHVRIGAETGYVLTEFLTADPVKSKRPIVTVANIERRERTSVYAAPREDAETVGAAWLGDELTLLGETRDGWRYVRYGYRYGYMPEAYLTADQ